MYNQTRVFSGKKYKLLAATPNHREAVKSKNRVKGMGGLARIVPIKHNGVPAYLVYVRR